MIVPPSVLAMPHHVQKAIACHELLHVRRRDWIFEVLEEGLRTVFWFHPAIWWLIGRIQLSREQVVDRAAVGLTESKERYIDALLVVALNKSRVALVPAPLFLRRSLLRQRVAQILQETTMTTRRLIASLTASTAALALAATVAVRSFPLEAQGQNAPTQQSTGAPVQIVKGGDHLLHASLAEYPRTGSRTARGGRRRPRRHDRRAWGGVRRPGGQRSGRAEARGARIRAPVALLTGSASLHHTPGHAAFHPAGQQRGVREPRLRLPHEEEDEQKAEPDKAQHAERVMKELELALQDPNASDRQKDEWKREYEKQALMLDKMLAEAAGKDGAEYTVRLAPRRPLFEGAPRLARIGGERVTSDTMKEFVRRAGISIGDPITEDTAKRLGEVARNLDEHLAVSFERDGSGGVILRLVNP